MEDEGEDRHTHSSGDTSIAADPLTPASETTLHACEFCGRKFVSRNQVFRHLRDTVNPCGTAIQESNESLQVAPSAVKKELRKAAGAEAKRARRRNKTGQTIQHTQHSVWLGDLPLPWTRHGSNYQRLRALLRAHLPRTIPQPWIKTVQRKAYRTKLVVDETTGEIVDGGVYLGYAIVVFRDELECQQVLDELNGREVCFDSVFSRHDVDTNQDFSALAAANVPPFSLKVRPVERNVLVPANTTRCFETTDTGNCTTSGRDPPLHDQLKPLLTKELDARTMQFSNKDTKEETLMTCVTASTSSANEMHSLALERAVAAMSASAARSEVYHTGRLIPNDIRDKLVDILKDLRWAVPNHRPGLTAERYLVLLTSVTNDLFYQDLRSACRELMNWVDPSFYYSGIAVTKNFVSSPHIDDRDQTFQYAISLGDFTNGGELCVDGLDGTGQHVIHVVTTHNRVARIDGRRVHWVRSWTGGDRYSLIFYDTSLHRPTSLLPLGVEESESVDADS